MDFALCPSQGPPRLVRFGVLPGDDVIATLDEVNNLLRVDQDLYGRLSTIEQALVLKTKQRELRVADHTRDELTLAA